MSEWGLKGGLGLKFLKGESKVKKGGLVIDLKGDPC